MAYKYREDLVGKRFLAVSGVTKINVNKVSEWGWKAGVIRAASLKDNKNKELQVLVEYDGVDWQRREWVAVYSRRTFRVFLVERTLVWAPRVFEGKDVKWPALTFSPLAADLTLQADAQPVEFLHDQRLEFLDYANLLPYQDWDPRLAGADVGIDATILSALSAEAGEWRTTQDGQRILTTTPSVLGGCRAQVYRAAGATQWYTAVIVGVNEHTGELTVTDDTVLEEHSEDPSLVQMRLLGDGVIESIMKGEVVGVMPRRSRSNLQRVERETTKSPATTGGRKKSAAVRSNGQIAPTEPPPQPAGLRTSVGSEQKDMVLQIGTNRYGLLQTKANPSAPGSGSRPDRINSGVHRYFPAMEEICLARDCGYNRSRRGVSIHYAPKNDERRNAWLKAIDVGSDLVDFMLKNKKKSRFFVCGDHFGFECYTDDLKLKADAVPRIMNTTNITATESSSMETTATRPQFEPRTGDIINLSDLFKLVLSFNLPAFISKNDLIQFAVLCNMLALSFKNKDATRLYTLDFMPVALNTYGNNPTVYSLLQENLNLPSIEDLNNLNMTIDPGLNANVLKMLKLKISRFTDKAKVCTLCLDIVSLKKNLHYDVEEDRLHGFHEIGENCQCLAGKFALVAMLRGIYGDIKIPVGYIITASLEKYQEINEWVDNVIDTLIDIGFDIKAIVTDLKPFFVSAFNHRKVDDKNNYITRRGKKIYYIFDAFALFTCAKNIFMEYDFYCADAKIAKWEHIENLYHVEEGKKIKLVPNLTKNNIEDNNDKFQVFDSKVANALSFYSELGLLDESVLETANFIAELSYLHNFLTSSDSTEQGEQNVTNENKQRGNRLSDIITFLSKLKLIQDFSKGHDNFKDKHSTDSPLRFIRGFLITINSIKNICEDLKVEEYNLCTRNLSQECFDDFHTNILSESGKESEMTCFEFNRAFRKVFVKTMLQNYHDSNVETNFIATFSDILNYIHDDNVSNRNLLNFDGFYNWTPDKDRERYLITTCYQYHGRCEEFVKYLLQSGKNPVIEVIKTSENEDVEHVTPDCDVYPPENFVNLVQELLLVHLKFAKKRPMSPQIGAAMLNFLIPRFVPFNSCTCLPLMFVAKLFIRTIIEDIVILNNEIFESNIDKIDICLEKHFMELILI